ncbi:MAG: hypothetical protein HKL92_04005 [Candidatus Eremiobacteraeota bacterium]|nr:hypothetical protein [Candidatus Eremiobacteraeota bacterium]NNM92484.1 hypothetical protein [Candidatus Eremiobacteraeota bacterium]
MRFFTRFTILALVVALFGLPQRSPAASFAGLAPCTPVAVEMIDTIDSGNARPGDFFRFQSINAVTAGAGIVIPTHTVGYGVVSVASPAGQHGVSGTLVLEPRYFVLHGQHYGVVLDHRANDLVRNGKSGNLPGYLGAIPIPGVSVAIGAFNYFHHGNNIVVKSGTMFVVFPSDSPSVERCQRAGSP